VWPPMNQVLLQHQPASVGRAMGSRWCSVSCSCVPAMSWHRGQPMVGPKLRSMLVRPRVVWLQLDLAKMAEALGQVVVVLEGVLHEAVLNGEAGSWDQEEEDEEGGDSDAADASVDEEDGKVRRLNTGCLLRVKDLPFASGGSVASRRCGLCVACCERCAVWCRLACPAGLEACSTTLLDANHPNVTLPAPPPLDLQVSCVVERATLLKAVLQFCIVMVAAGQGAAAAAAAATAACCSSVWVASWSNVVVQRWRRAAQRRSRAHRGQLNELHAAGCRPLEAGRSLSAGARMWWRRCSGSWRRRTAAA
jgi:hypothetical protein